VLCDNLGRLGLIEIGYSGRTTSGGTFVERDYRFKLLLTDLGKQFMAACVTAPGVVHARVTVTAPNNSTEET
jgi:hypothetical protein